jgi:pyruvate ferredoxin oxidoreductase alpha subunit
MSKFDIMEGSKAIAEAVALCRPHVISAYPITPQTHIVEYLAKKVADGELVTDFSTVESEMAAASYVLGASAAGGRTYTASSSQGILLMSEVLYNLAGLRLPAVITCANRAVSAPLNIWNDHQDSMAVRDTGLIQLFARDAQEAADLHIQAFRIAEDSRVELPVMVCVDGYLITHAFEPVELPEQSEVDAFLPPRQTDRKLDPRHPLTFGAFADQGYYMEARFQLQQAVLRSRGVIEEVGADFTKAFGREYGKHVEAYRADDAAALFVGMGSMMGTVEDAVDELRAQGKKVGCLRLRTYRPFPAEDICAAIRGGQKVGILDRSISMGAGGIVASEVRSALQAKSVRAEVTGFIVGLGGRDVTAETISRLLQRLEGPPADAVFVDLKPELLGDLAQTWKSTWETVATTY